MILYQPVAEYSAWLWPAMADHLWQATLFVLIVTLLAVLLKRGPARIRYALWLTAGAKLVLPSAIIAFLAEQGGLDLSVLSKANNTSEFLVPEFVVAFSRIRHQAVELAHPVDTTSRATHGSKGIYLVLTVTWILGLTFLIVRWWKRRRQLLGAIRAGVKVRIGREAEILSRVRTSLLVKQDVQLIVSAQIMEPGAWGILKRMIILPERLGDHLSDSELEAVLLHELVHMKRWDNLVSHFQMVFCSFFWFYPIAWVIDRKLLAEREQACDEEVLRLCRSPDHYVSSLWKVFRFCIGHNVAGVSLAVGSNLKRRIENIMSGNIQFTLKWWHRMLLAGSAIAMVLVSLATGFYSQGTGNISGSIYDSSGAAIPGAMVTLSNLESGSKEIVYTNDPGEYSFQSLPEANYVMEVSKLGFKLFQRKDVNINANEKQRLDVVLGVGEIVQTVEVVGKFPRVGPAPSSEVGLPRRIRVGGNVQQANLISQTNPVYPELAQQAGIEGTVLLEAIIGKDGSVVNSRVVNSLAHPFLVEAAMEAVKQWRYKPTLLNGEPIEVVTTIAVKFRLAQAE